MFDSLSNRLQDVFRTLRGEARLSESAVETALREIRLALLEADVNFKVVKAFVDRVRERAVGHDVLRSLTPAQQVVKIVRDELLALFGEAPGGLRPASETPRAIMLLGLQGSGKTTTAAKLALRFKSEGRRPLLVAADLSRPAAVEQLHVLGKQVHAEVFSGAGADPVAVAQGGVEHARKQGLTPVIIDTAGRLSINEALMDELARVRAAVAPLEILLVLDALTGQDALATAKRFDERLDLTGFILTKMDGDARGGAALSMRAVTGKPIRLAGMGEKVDALDYFHPGRVAGRILGRGDILALVEKVSGAVDEREAQRLEKKLRREKKFDLEDFLSAMRQAKRLGSMSQILSFLPGVKVSDEQLELGQRELKCFEAIVCSMTPSERRDVRVLNATRRQRIARGSGTSVQQVNRFIKQFQEMQRMAGKLLGGSVR
jgi:signal recognition particle subunit SRP54